MYLCYDWAMGVFTTSWWVVNQPIVVVIFTLLPQVQKHFHPTLGGVTPYTIMIYVDIIALVTLCFAGLCSRA